MFYLPAGAKYTSFSLKVNKSLGYDKINFNVIKKSFSELCEPLKHVFNLSIENGVLPDKLKIARVSPLYKVGVSSDLTNCRPIFVLPCFPKIFERIMSNQIMSGCKKLVETEYIKRHNNTLKVLAGKWTVENGLIPEETKWYTTN